MPQTSPMNWFNLSMLMILSMMNIFSYMNEKTVYKNSNKMKFNFIMWSWNW